MTETYRCPTCRQAIRSRTRTLDFFCRSCFTTVVVIDERWAHVKRVQDPDPVLLPTAACLGGAAPCAP